ncbi:unnamed protein product [Malus baccata var. baccata]
MCTLEKRSDLFFLTLTNDDDHCLGLPIIDSLLCSYPMAHDYFLMRRDIGVLSMSEVNMGLPFPDHFMAAFRLKIGLVSGMSGMKAKGDEAVNMGIVESAHESAESTVERKWNGDIFVEIRKSLYPGLSGVVGVAIATPKVKL